MRVEDYLLTATLKGVLAQRLVRRLCAACKRTEPAAPALIEKFALDRLEGSRDLALCHPVGCPECRGTGFRGRRAIGELLLPSRAVDRLILERADDMAIERAAVTDGMRPLFDSGLMAVLAGETTIEEVVRCIRGEA
jgi:general secretion pathway protein E